MLFKEDLFGTLEAVLFVSSEPIPEEKLKEVLAVGTEEFDEILSEYRESLELPGRGIRLVQVAGGYKLMTKPVYEDAVEKIAKPQGGLLSRAALETLAIIAYKQPVTRSEVEGIRGVNADSMIYKLLEKELIIEVGRKEVPGHPNLYGTTDKFLLQLGINSLDQLPPLKEPESQPEPGEEELENTSDGTVLEILGRKE